jgi:cytochrome c oxidase subunit III
MTVVLDSDVESLADLSPRLPMDGGNGGGIDGRSRRRESGDGDDGRPDDDSAAQSRSRMSPEVFGMFMFVLSEVVLFGVLIFAFAWARSVQPVWPPPGQPRLPLGITGLNTILLLVSGLTVFRAWNHVRNGRAQQLRRWLLVTTFLGVTFLAIQGVEWVRLISFGLTAAANLYGATFYIIVGIHAIHVFIAVLMMAYVAYRSSTGIYTMEDHSGVSVAAIFWFFVVLVWPLIYLTVYLL